MSEIISTEYPYLVNHTKKEIRQIPFNMTLWNKRSGVLNSLSLLKDVMVSTWKTLRRSEWTDFDDIAVIVDYDPKIREYLNNSYVLK